MTDEDVAEFRRLAGVVFDRTRPGSERLPELRKFKELIDRTGAASRIGTFWTAAPDVPFEFDFVQDEIDRIEFEAKIAELMKALGRSP